MRKFIQFFLIGFLFYFINISVGNAAIINAKSCSQADVQNAINSATNDDVVSIPAGNCTWNSSVSIPGTKGITLDGGGDTITSSNLANTALISITTNANTTTRITNFIFSLTTGQWNGDHAVEVDGGFSNAKFRIDHCTFSSSQGSVVFINVHRSLGLIDNCAFSSDNASEMIHNEAYGASSSTGWTVDVTPGSDDALYIEDCTFTKYSQPDVYSHGTSAIQSYYGARTVVRHNIFLMTQLDQHGTAGMIGARWWEIYENVFNARPNCYGMGVVLRAGSGAVFNNSIAVVGLRAAGIELQEEDTGTYPLLYQIGRGKNQTSDPAYFWNNTTLGDPSPSVGAAYIQVNRDYYLSAKPGYKPYTYPHPLQTPGSIPSPKNLRYQ